MKFLNLNTGYSFDALWKENQEQGYIFWFPAEQSIGLTYTMPIAVITNSNMPLHLQLEENPIFSFITLSDSVEIIDGYSFDGKPKYSYSIETTPESINGSNEKYVHVFNIACHSDNASEYICKINITDNSQDEGSNGFIRVGADFYGEHEPSYINLSNMGVELPTTIQKAIYDANVHEDITDNILINRKFKELLSNYWDIIANKGSYKSLLNSLKWFEWDNKLQLKEIYKYNKGPKSFFIDKDLSYSITEVVENNISNLIKTNYISLYYSLYNEEPEYDTEYNPKLTEIVLNWSINDIKLKIALLAKFFGIYFLPIYLSILHATAEDIVFTNSIKAIHGSKHSRHDQFADFNYIECNIKDTDTFGITNVKAQVTSDTVFGVQYPKTEVCGVDLFPTDSEINEDNIKTFAQQYYVGPGAIIPINLTITNRESSEFVKQTIIDYIDENNNIVQLKFYNVFNTDEKSNINISFNFLAKTAKVYKLNLTFILNSSKVLTRQVILNIEDTDSVNINIYKIVSKDDTFGLNHLELYDTSCSQYVFGIQNKKRTIQNSYYTQYLPYMNNTNPMYGTYKGIKLSRTVIVDIKSVEESNLEGVINSLSATFNNYLLLAKYKLELDEETGKPIEGKSIITNIPTYLIFISKYFFAELPEALEVPEKCKIIRNELVFYPQFHKLEKIDGNSIDDYTLSQYDAICCAVEINNGSSQIPFRYGHLITDSEWSFYNHLTNETINHPNSSQQPFIADTNKILPEGYYDITFRYSLTSGDVNEYKLDSAFRIKNK